MDQGEFADDIFQRGIFFLFFEHAQAAQQRQTGVPQRGQLTGKVVKTFDLTLAAEAGDLDFDLD